MAGPVFLIGGGWTAEAFPETWGRFVPAVNAIGGGRIVCVLLDMDDLDDRTAYAGRLTDALASAGAGDGVSAVFVTPERPLQPGDLAGAAGIAVGGGLTPDYQQAIVPSAGEAIAELVASGVPYAGFSAGSAIAAEAGIVGGWKLPLPAGASGREVPICAEDVSEDEEFLAVRPGIGLVPFAVDVHAAQWGTLARLIHAVRAGAVAAGWAIDEDTALEVSCGEVAAVHGLGSAYHVTPDDGDGVRVAVRTAGPHS
ncbi:MAG: Type 1 glutamine amidotransferase-like domain-containing protein [Thermomicrobiales bacterium]